MRLLLGSLIVAGSTHWHCSSNTTHHKGTSSQQTQGGLTAGVVHHSQLAHPIPAHIVDVDGDGAPDVLLENVTLLARGDHFEEAPPAPPPDEAPAPVRLDDLDHDGTLDRIWLDDALFWERTPR
jgi:hypothetical protein